ncbi:unnamed protein product [Heligmosomoides polygyrus]|uniref:Carrier domain-containing protein n=1 Tax=Heligmosomoides polygyrus TaxID=6339 RepID=A0A183G2Q1_HELPZ|nr:unnamed protein product [Heligmosomoides polygyrus]
MASRRRAEHVGNRAWRAVDVPNTSAARNFGPGDIEVVEHGSEVDQSTSIDIIDLLRMTLKRHETSALGVIEVAEHESEVDQSISIDIIDFLRMALKRRETSALGVIEIAEHESDVGSIDPSRLT